MRLRSSLVETLFLAGSVAFLLPIGRLADASDKVTIYKIGLASFALSSVAVAFFSSMPAILFLRFVQGVTASATAATAPTILADLVPAQRRGAVYGLMIAAVYAGLTLGPVCAGYPVAFWNWRAVFWAGGALVGLGYVAIQLLLSSRWRPVRRTAQSIFRAPRCSPRRCWRWRSAARRSRARSLAMRASRRGSP